LWAIDVAAAAAAVPAVSFRSINDTSLPCVVQNYMNEEMRQECVDMICTAVERYASNYEQAARMVKEQMDKKYNENWIVIIGQGFSFEVTHEVKHVLWMYNCDTAILCFKAGARQVGT